jgi:uncharacterized protein YbcI
MRERQSIAVESGPLGAAIARGVVRCYRRHRGRGPTSARTFYRDNCVVVVLGDFMTLAERRLVDAGTDAAVEELSRAIRSAMRDDLVASVEAATGERVITTLGGESIRANVAFDFFVLAGPAAAPPADAG